MNEVCASADRMLGGQARVLVALLGVYARGGRATVRGVAAAADRSVQRTHHHLLGLRRAGLVAWEPGAAGTLRPLVTVVGVNGRVLDRGRDDDRINALIASGVAQQDRRAALRARAVGEAL